MTTPPVYRTELTPLSFLERAAMVFGEKRAITYRDRDLTYQEMAALTSRVARALEASGVEKGDRVAFLCPNIPEMLVAHFAVPLVRAVLVAVNIRLSPEEIRYILDHSGSKILVGDSEFLAKLSEIVGDLATVGEIVSIDDSGVHVPFETVSWETFPGTRQRRAAALDGGRRGADDLYQLHLRHHRSAQRRDVHAPGRLSQRPR